MKKSIKRQQRQELLKRKQYLKKQPPPNASKADSAVCSSCGTPLEQIGDDDEDIAWLLHTLQGGRNFQDKGGLTSFYDAAEDADYLSNGIRVKFHPNLLEIVAPKSMRNTQYLDTLIAEAAICYYSDYETYRSVYVERGQAAALAYFLETAGDVELDVSFRQVSIPVTARARLY